MRWMIAVVLATAGCPDPSAIPASPDAPAVDPPPASNCVRGPAPPVTWCREHRTGYAVSEDTISSRGSLRVEDWANISNDAHGHDETIYGERGNPIQRVSTGAFAGYMYATCDDEGRVELEHRTNGIEQRTRYDLADHILTFEWDQDGDGAYEDRWTYRYDAHRLLVRQEHDIGIGAPVDLVFAYTNDDRGRMVTATTDRGADGTIDQTMRNTWDDQDHEIEQETFDAEGELVERWTRRYDGPRLVETEVAGSAPYRWTRRYDTAGRLIETDSFDVKANHLDGRLTEAYDELGRPAAIDEDVGVDGTIDEQIRWDYCP